MSSIEGQRNSYDHIDRISRRSLCDKVMSGWPMGSYNSDTIVLGPLEELQSANQKRHHRRTVSLPLGLHPVNDTVKKVLSDCGISNVDAVRVVIEAEDADDYPRLSVMIHDDSQSDDGGKRIVRNGEQADSNGVPVVKINQDSWRATLYFLSGTIDRIKRSEITL